MSLQGRTFQKSSLDRDPNPTVLIVDDDSLARDRLKYVLTKQGHEFPLHMLFAASISEAKEILATTPVHAVLLDKNLGPDESNPDQNGIKSIPSLLEIQPHLQILLVTGSNNVNDAVEAMRLGAFDYVTKETPDALLLEHIKRTVSISKISFQNTQRGKVLESEPIELGGKSKAFKEVLKKAEIVAETDRPVLLLGDSGTGKTALAKLIDKRRKKFLDQEDRPFFSINIASLASDVVESELFGHEKGAFTDASKTRQGFFELSNNGTLFIDEVGEASMDLQAKLLTVIESGEFFRLGSSTKMKTSAKLIFATNQNLEELVKKKKFRHDLLMRINSFQIEMPDLDARREDIPDIIRALLPKSTKQNNVSIKFEDIPKDFIEQLMNTKLEGNIRGIATQLDRLLVFAPRDSKRRPILKHWRSIKELREMGSRSGFEKNPELKPITLDELLMRPFDVVDSAFPGIKEFINLVKNKVILDAHKKHQGEPQQMAKALKVTGSYIYPLMSQHLHTDNGNRSDSQAAGPGGVQ